MTTVIYPGTFDPITNGHLDIIERCASLFPQVLVAVAKSPSKRPMFELEQRVAFARQSVAHLNNVRVEGFSGLLATFIQQHNIQAIIRGVRGVADFEYELQLSHLNRLLTQGVESLFFPPSDRWSYVSSTMIREILLHGGDIQPLVPPAVFAALASAR